MPLIIGTACAVGVLLGGLINFSGVSGHFLSNPDKAKLSRLIDYINYKYVDKVNTDSIVDVAIKTVLGQLDPHSVYLSANEFDRIAQEMNGGFVGIGVHFYRLKDTIAVIRPVSGGPAAKVDILPGDRILYANEIPLFTSTITQDSIQKILRGEVGSTLQLKIKRQGQSNLLVKTLTRERVPIKSVTAAYMLNDSLGYVKIQRFSKTTYKEFKTAIDKLKNQGAKEITLDLRDNGGGYLEEAIKVADEFLPEGKLIVFTKNRENKVHKTFATDQGDFEHTRVYVLINQNTASASEVIAGALQDNDVGTIIGRRSYGKGLVQRELNLGDGSAVRLTVARYYTPTGRSIQEPYKKESRAEYYHNHMRRYGNGELTNRDSIPVNDSLKFTTPKGKIVYGGGGIIPDIFVAEDINYKKESLDYMLKGGMMDKFIFEVMDKDRSYYNHLTRAEFKADSPAIKQLVDDYMSYLEDYKLSFKTKNYQNLLVTYLKATMAHQLYGNTLYAEILGQDDPCIQKVKELEAQKTDDKPTAIN